MLPSDRTMLELKRADGKGSGRVCFPGRTLGLLFEKPSLRTRVSFEAAITRLGGNAIFLRGEDVGLGIRESVADFARVLSQYVDALAVRTFSHSTVEELARQAAIPVINALSRRRPSLPGDGRPDDDRRAAWARRRARRLVFVGDGNNVARSLAIGLGAAGGASSSLASPQATSSPAISRRRFAATFPGHPPGRRARSRAAVAGRRRGLHRRLGQHGAGARGRRAARGVRALPGQRRPAAHARGRRDLPPLPPRPPREEVTSESSTARDSQVLLQAANRLHFQMALLLWLHGRKPHG